MEIMLNGERREVAARMLAEALAELGYDTAHIATALNGSFVAARLRAETPLQAGDAVEVVAPRQGG